MPKLNELLNNYWLIAAASNAESDEGNAEATIIREQILELVKTIDKAADFEAELMAEIFPVENTNGMDAIEKMSEDLKALHGQHLSLTNELHSSKAYASALKVSHENLIADFNKLTIEFNKCFDENVKLADFFKMVSNFVASKIESVVPLHLDSGVYSCIGYMVALEQREKAATSLLKANTVNFNTSIKERDMTIASLKACINESNWRNRI